VIVDERARTDPVELLERVVKIADRALARDATVAVPETTLRALANQIEAARLEHHDNGDRLIDDEAAMLLQALLNAELYALDRNDNKAIRWRIIASALIPFVRTDLALAVAGKQVLR